MAKTDKTPEEIQGKLNQENTEENDSSSSNAEQTNPESDNNMDVSKLVDQLMEAYPNVARGVVYEATVSINNETFLANYLAEQERINTYTEGELTVGDLFLKNDPSELHAVLDLGGKIGLSKSMTIMVSGLLGIGKTLYHVMTNDDIRKKLDDIDLNHSKRLIEKANALTNKSAVEEQKTDKKEGK